METSGIIFIEQYVRGLPEFDDNETKKGTVVEHSFTIKDLDVEKGLYGAFLKLNSSTEESKNPPYEFRMECMMPAYLDKGDLEPENIETVRKMLFQMLLASTRERLASLTSRSTWDSFHLGPFPYSAMATEEDAE